MLLWDKIQGEFLMTLTCVFCSTPFEAETQLENPVCRACATKKTAAIVKTVKKETGSRHGSVHHYRET